MTACKGKLSALLIIGLVIAVVAPSTVSADRIAKTEQIVPVGETTLTYFGQLITFNTPTQLRVQFLPAPSGSFTMRFIAGTPSPSVCTIRHRNTGQTVYDDPPPWSDWKEFDFYEGGFIEK